MYDGLRIILFSGAIFGRGGGDGNGDGGDTNGDDDHDDGGGGDGGDDCGSERRRRRRRRGMEYNKTAEARMFRNNINPRVRDSKAAPKR